MAPRIIFEQELAVLKVSLEEMGRFVEHSIDRVFEAMKDGDEELITSIIKSDRTVNDMEKNIESRCLSLITRQQPIARDLRMVTAALKVVTDIERIGDHAVDIAELVLRCQKVDILQFCIHISPMVEAAKQMVHDSVEAFINRDVEAAKEVIDHDDVVDDLFNKVKEDIIMALKNGGKDPDACVDVLMIAKYLERIGDHAVNIGEWEIFQETGAIDNIRIL